MNIFHLELSTNALHSLVDFYSNVLELPVNVSGTRGSVRAGKTDLVFIESPGFDGGYHFAFNIPENQFASAKEWIASRVPLLRDVEGRDEFASEVWNSHSLYFKDAAGNVLEFIARHNLKNGADGAFSSSQILNVSEIGLPSEDVIGLANLLCAQLGLSVFHQQPNEHFTPVGDDNGLFILPIKDRVWIPNSGVPAQLLPVNVNVDVNGRSWRVIGVPYEITESA